MNQGQGYHSKQHRNRAAKHDQPNNPRLPMGPQRDTLTMRLRLPGGVMYRVDRVSKAMATFRLIRIWPNGQEELMCQHPGSMIGCAEKAEQTLAEQRACLNIGKRGTVRAPIFMDSIGCIPQAFINAAIADQLDSHSYMLGVTAKFNPQPSEDVRTLWRVQREGYAL
jgi:hypothetical protein